MGFGSAVKSAVTSWGVSYSEGLAIGVERLEEESRLYLSDGRYYSILLKSFIAFPPNGL